MFVLALPLAAGSHAAGARRLRRRPVGRDRHGDRRIGRARHHGVERHRDAAGAASGARPMRPARGDVGALLLTVRRIAIFGDPAARLSLLPLRRRRPARLDRAALLRRDRAARAGLLRRPDLAARHRARRDRRHDRRHPRLGLYAAAAELRRRRPGRRQHPHRTARSGSPCCGRRPCSASTCRRWCTAWSGAWRSTSLAYVGFSLARAPASIERLQADLFVPPDLAPMTPSFRLWRSVGHGRGADRDGRALSRRGAHPHLVRRASRRAAASASSPRREADFQLLRFAEHLLASAIGAASSRLVLSLLLRKRTVSTKAALKLLDDANAAIHYNREILQTALDHVRQGIAVFDKDLQLVCWNRQFGDILDLPRELIRVGIGLDEILRFNAEQRRVRSRRGRDAGATSASPRYVRRRAVPRALSRPRPRHRGARQPHAGRRHRHHLHRHHAERRGGRGAGARQRNAGAARARAHRGADAAQRRARPRQGGGRRGQHLEDALPRRRQPRHPAAAQRRAALRHQPGRAAAAAARTARLVGNVDASLEAVEEIFGALLDISRLDTGAMQAGDRRASASTSCCASSRSSSRRWPARRASSSRSCRARSTVRSDRRLLRRLLQNLVSNAIKYTPQGPRAGRLPPARRQPAHRRLRHRARHPALQAAASCSRSSIASTRAPRWRAASASASRSSSASRACSTTRSSSTRRSAAARISRSRCRSRRRRRGCAAAARSAAVDRGQLAGMRGAVHRQRAEDPRRHGDAARRLGLPGAQGARSGGGHRGAAPRSRPRPTACWSTIISTTATASRRSPSCAAVRRRAAGHPDHRRPQRRRARGRARARHPGAEQAGQAGGAARAARAMARPAGRGGGVTPQGVIARRPKADEAISDPRMARKEIASFARNDSACAQCSGAACGHWPTSILAAAITAWVRLSTPSFCRIAETCALTVASETVELVGDLLVEQPLRQHHQHAHLLRRERREPRQQRGGLGVGAGVEIDVGRRPHAAPEHALRSPRASPRCRASSG